MNPDQTAPKRESSLIWVHIVCNIGSLSAYAYERALMLEKRLIFKFNPQEIESVFFIANRS